MDMIFKAFCMLGVACIATPALAACPLSVGAPVANRITAAVNLLADFATTSCEAVTESSGRCSVICASTQRITDNESRRQAWYAFGVAAAGKSAREAGLHQFDQFYLIDRELGVLRRRAAISFARASALQEEIQNDRVSPQTFLRNVLNNVQIGPVPVAVAAPPPTAAPAPESRGTPQSREDLVRQLRKSLDIEHGGSSAVMEAQRLLALLGFDPGPADGRLGPRTRQALQTWRTQNGLPAGDDIDEATLNRLRIHARRD